MIKFYFTLKNPFPIAYKYRDSDQIDYLCRDWSLTKNKAFEIQFTKWAPTTIFSVGLDTCWIGQDHGGIRFDIELFGYFLNLNLYDKRHWDWENGCWEKHDELGK